MAPGERQVRVVGISVKPEHLAKLLPSLELDDSGKRTRLNGDIVGVVNHRHEISKQPRHSHVCAHMALITRMPEWDGMLSQKLCSFDYCLLKVAGNSQELRGLSNIFTDKDLAVSVSLPVECVITLKEHTPSSGWYRDRASSILSKIAVMLARNSGIFSDLGPMKYALMTLWGFLIDILSRQKQLQDSLFGLFPAT